MPTAVVVIEIEVILQSVRPNHVIATLREAEDDAAGRVLASRYRLEAHRDIDSGVRTAGGDNHVESIARRGLHQCPATLWSALHLLDCPFAGHGLPAIQRSAEVEATAGLGGPVTAVFE